MNRLAFFILPLFMRVSSSLLCLSLTCLPILAQGKGGSESPGVSRSSIDTSREPIVYEKVRGVIRYGEDGRGTKEVTARIRVQSYTGVQKVGQLVFPYNGGNERLEVRSVRVTKPDGSVVIAGAETVVDVSSPIVQEALMYTDARQKHVSVPGLSVGDIVEYDVVTRVFEPLTPGEFWDGWNFMSQSVCLDEELVLDVPADRAIKIRNPEGVEPSVAEEGGRRRYTWKTQNPKAVEPINSFGNFQNFDPAEMLKGFNVEPPRRMLFSTFQTWEEIGQWYGSLAKEWQTPTPEVRAKAEEITRGATTPLAKVMAVYDFVSHIRYVSLSFGMGRYQPHSASEVLANGYGDCKDKATLLDALLAAEGIPSATALIQSQGDLDPEIPTPYQFNHAINLVSIEGKDVWLDSTSGVAPFGYLLPQLRGKTALVALFPQKSQLQKTTASDAGPRIYRLNIEKTIADNGGEEAELAVDVQGGDWEVLLRLLLSRITPAQLGQMLSGDPKLSANSYQGTYTDVKAGDPFDLKKPFRLEARYSQKIDISKNPQVLPVVTGYVSPMASDVVSRILPLAGMTLGDKKPPILLGGPKELFLHLKVTRPLTDEAKSLQPVHLTKDFADYSLEVNSNNTAMTADAHLILRANEVGRDHAEEYISFRKSVVASLSWPSSILSPTKKASTSVPSRTDNVPKKADSPAKPFFDSARRAAGNREYANAALLYEEAVAKDPNYAEAWNALGYAYNQIHRYDRAETAFQKALALDPTAKYAHENLGQALEGQKKYEEAIPEYRKEIEIDPKNKWPRTSLGRVYVLLKQYDKAIPELEALTSLESNDPAVYFNLGRAYAKTGQPEKAIKALEHSVELEPVPARWNWVAYEMAINKLALDEAQKYAESAIAATVQQMRDVSLDHVSNDDIRLPAQLSAYWDTLGWIRFQQGNLAEAEKYVNCAWLVRSVGEIGDHLGQIYERQGHKAEAIQAYELALVATQPMPETKDRLTALLGSGSDLETITQQARQQLAEVRSLKIKNVHNVEGIAEFWILISPGPKVKGVKFISGDDALQQYAKEIETVNYPDCFPQATELQLLRKGRLSCTQSSPECRLLLQSAETVRSAN